MPKDQTAKKKVPREASKNMVRLILTIDGDPTLLGLFQNSHIPKNRELLSAMLEHHYATIVGKGNHGSKDIYSDVLDTLQCVPFALCHPTALISPLQENGEGSYRCHCCL